jgi:predicted RNA-binding Zn-ribbon protein involved in translation (DUF1610 family)
VNADDRANKLYWGSDRSVNQIADELDLSKGALYEMIRPLATGFGCPICGAEVVHSNRTAKDRGRVDCPSCAWDGTEDEAVGGPEATDGPDPAAPRAPRLDGVDPVDEIYPADDYDAPGPLPAAEAERVTSVRRLMTGGALLGAAVGLALVLWARRR